MDKNYSFDEVNGSLRTVLIKNKYIGYFTHLPVDVHTVPKSYHVYEVSRHPSLGMPDAITKRVKNRKNFYGTILTTDDLGLNMFKPVLPLKSKDGDLFEFMFGTKDENGEYEIDGCLTDIMPVWAIDKFMLNKANDAVIVPVVQELDDDGNVIEEREMNEDEFNLFLKMQNEAADNLAKAEYADATDSNEEVNEVHSKIIYDADNAAITNKPLSEHSKFIYDAEFDAASSQ